MSKQERFFDVPTEGLPPNRRIYNAAKAPFVYLWEVLVWASAPWLKAACLVFPAVGFMALFQHYGATPPEGWFSVARATMTMGMVWTFYLGFVVMIFDAFSRR